MKLFSNNIVPYASAEGDKIYPIVVDIKKGIKSGEAISFVTADNQVGVITVDFMDGNSSYSIEGCMVTSTIHRPDGTVLEIPCDIISQSTIEIPLGINGTYQEGTHTFDLKIIRGNGKVIGVPTMSYSVSGSLSSDGVVEGDDRLPVLTMVLDNAQDKLTRLDRAIAGATNDLEVKEARDGEVTLNARLERDLAKGKIHFVDIEGSSMSTESEEGYLENVEILGNTWQDSENLEDIRSVGTKVEGQELYEIPTLSTRKNLFNPKEHTKDTYTLNSPQASYFGRRIKVPKPNTPYTLSVLSENLPEGHWCVINFYENGKIIPVFNVNKYSGNTHTELGFATMYSDSEGYVDITVYVQDKQSSKHWDAYLNLPIQLEEGTKATTYEPYQGHKLIILSPVQLEKVGDVADRIVCKDGVWGIEKNIGEIVLNGKENWSYRHSNTAFYFYQVELPFNTKNQYDNKLITNKYIAEVDWGKQYEYCFVNEYNGLVVSSSISTLNEFKDSLKAIPLQVYYQTAQPQFILHPARRYTQPQH